MLRNRWWLASIGLVMWGVSGCSMCPQSPEDYTYAAYGGLLQRADRIHGRVGSAFAPAEGAPAGPPTPIDHDPLLLAPEYAAQEPSAAASEPYYSQATPTAFDPGDILSSEAK
jgi:hypothetical protein